MSSNGETVAHAAGGGYGPPPGYGGGGPPPGGGPPGWGAPPGPFGPPPPPGGFGPPGYPPPGYGMPPYGGGYPPIVPQPHALSIVSLVVGILSLVGSCIWCVAFPLNITGLVCGILGMNKANTEPHVYGGKGLAIAGIVCSAASIGIALIILVLQLTVWTSRRFFWFPGI